MRSIAAAVLFAALSGACGNSGSPAADGGTGDDDAVDAYPDYKCWPPVPQIPHGSIELGKGGVAFSEMPETLHLEYGFQGGFMVKVWNRMTGFSPGTDDLSDPSNPFTRVRATFVDSDAPLQLPGDCAERVNYVPNSVGGYDYPSETATIFNTCWGTDMLVGRQLKITAELMDAAGNYATDSKIITVADSLDPTFHNIPTTPGCGQ